MTDSDSTRAGNTAVRGASHVQLLCLAAAWLSTTAVCWRVEGARLLAAIDSPAGALGWFTHWNLDTTLVLVVLLLLPVIMAGRLWGHSVRSIKAQFRTARVSGVDAADHHSNCLIPTVGLFLLSFLCSVSIGMRQIELPPLSSAPGLPQVVRFDSLPPAYHDEYSYLLQARTFLAGRVSWPGVSVRPNLFHQIHVLNEPRTASRYFPWTGFWLAPFVRVGHPYLGQWLAGAFSCAFFFRSLLKLLSARWALVGGALIAVSPGLAVFSNLLLAHHATMLALSVFLWSFLRLMDSGAVHDAWLAGIALTLAMLGRPMTAAGFALPFGVWLVSNVFRSLRSGSPARTSLRSLRVLVAFGIPLTGGFAVLGFMNHEITGQWTRSAYQYYTDTWTPRHRFGFDNVEIGSQLDGPKVLQAYDRWATNLTPEKAAENVGNRVIAGAQWTLGIGALLFAMISAVPSLLPRRGTDVRLILVLCSVVSLHVVHVPYWFDGIMHWHYVFETAPLLLMLATVGLRNAANALHPLGATRLVNLWLLALVAASLAPNWLDSDSFWGPSRASQAVGEQSFSRLRFEFFRRMTHSSDIERPCLVMVDETKSDPQLSYIINPPDLTGDVLVCRLPSSTSEVATLHLAFPERTLYRFDPESFEFTLAERKLK